MLTPMPLYSASIPIPGEPLRLPLSLLNPLRG